MQLKSFGAPQDFSGLYIAKGKNIHTSLLKYNLSMFADKKMYGLDKVETFDLKSNTKLLDNQKLAVATNEDSWIISAIKNSSFVKHEKQPISDFEFKRFVKSIMHKKVNVVNAKKFTQAIDANKINFES